MPQSNKGELNLTLSGAVSVRPNADGSKTSPVDLLANSGNPVDYPKLGRVVWDFATMNHKSKMQLDWEHKDTIGYINHFDFSEGSLKLSGAIVPAGKGPSSEIAENVIAKMSEGVPYESSIHSEGGRLENVESGKSVTVNGKSFSGPLSVLRDWRLASTAICKFGRDSETMAELRLAASKDGDDMKLNDEQLGKIKLSFGSNVPSDLTVDNGFDLLLKLANDNGASFTAAQTEVTTLKTKVADLESKVGSKSAPPTSRELFFAAESLKNARQARLAKSENIIRSGDGTKAIIDKLSGSIATRQPKIEGLTLSRNTQDGDASLMDDIAAAIEQENLLMNAIDSLAGSKIGVPSGKTLSASDQLASFTASDHDDADEKKIRDDGLEAGKKYRDSLLASRGIEVAK